MADLCHQSPLECLNNGQCAVNITLNTTYCQCRPCQTGVFCENDAWRQGRFDTTYTYLIVYIIGLCFSILNNSLSLELFISCKRIFRTNCGVYLIVYSILSLVSNILLVVVTALEYYPNQFHSNHKQFEVFNCYVSKIGYNTLVYLCIWFSSCIAFERGLIIWSDSKMNASRWRSLVTTFVVFAIAGGSATPMLLYKCDWENVPNLQIVRTVFVSFYIITGILIYILATLLLMNSFTRRIRRYGTESGSFMKTFFKLFYTHLFIFVPPIAYAVGYIPYTIIISSKNRNHSYFQCGITIGEYIIKVLMESLQGVPFVITWLLFVFPSKVYMTEFYSSTRSGRWLVQIIVFFQSCRDRTKALIRPPHAI